MAISMMRSALLRNSLRTASKPSAPTRRGFSSSAHHDDAYEAAKWEKIAYLGAATCTILAIYNLSKGHPHYETPPEYPYLHIRNKEFPWELAGEDMMPISNIAQNCMVVFFFVFLVCVEINSLSQFQYFKPVLGSVHLFLEIFDA
ncbi:hypothetical protein D5086_014486 [Populus alba]|uniref:Uncharacterized protein n=1 Tax=Populus alba TaxID=43335 RepID=A0ACC4BYE3_POPAL